LLYFFFFFFVVVEIQPFVVHDGHLHSMSAGCSAGSGASAAAGTAGAAGTVGAGAVFFFLLPFFVLVFLVFFVGGGGAGERSRFAGPPPVCMRAVCLMRPMRLHRQIERQTHRHATQLR
jgi:hypothetical protein